MTGVELSVLGPVSAARDGRPLDLGGPRQRAVLAVLVAAAPGTVGAGELIGQAWPDGAEVGPGTLHHYVSRLRSALEPDRRAGSPPEVLVRRGTGYALAVDPGAVDAVRFTRAAARGSGALAAGRPAEAAGLLSGALGLWRGTAYADVADLAALVPAVARLTELRTAATEDLVDALLQAGRTAEAVGRAREHTASHPLRERGWELLALALYRSGRQADALAALATVRRILGEELGLDPGPGLAAVEAAVRAQEVPAAPAPPPARARALPLPLGDLVGRDADAAAADTDLDRSRLVTLTGPGGVGKTRLALAVAHRRAARGEDAALVRLDALDDPSLLPATVAAALGLPGAPDAAALADRVAGWAGLLVLDGCEHLVDSAAALVPALLGAAPGLRVLATSREALDVGGEQLHAVRPLSPEHAAELFTRRARTALPGRTPEDGETEDVRRICAGLDGLPLALELAAARVRVLSVRQLAGALDADPFAVLTDAPRDAPRSHRGLARTVEWSTRALPPVERSLFLRLACFAGDVDLEAVAAVLPGHPGPDAGPALALVTGLVRRSLLQVEPGPGPRRYRMLGTLRRFALDRAADGERAEARALHRRYVLRRVQAAERLLRGPDAAGALAGLLRDRAEHRAALASAEQAGDAGLLLDLAAALSWSWYRGGDIAEGRRALTRAVAAAEGVAADRDARVARALLGLGKLHYLAGDPDPAASALERAEVLADRTGEPAVAANARSWRAHVAGLTGPGPAAVALAEDAVEQAAAAGEPWVSAEALMTLGLTRRSTGTGGDPRPALEAAVAVAEGAGYAWGAVSSSWALMKAATDAGDSAGALAAAARMRAPLVADGDLTSWLVLVHSSAAVLARTGRAEEAATLAGAVQELGSRVGFAPERMDPVDGPREAAAVRDALDAAAYARAVAAGRSLSRDAVDDLLRSLLG
ncbi:BTAD domain-containing putative transcriptional regulator [Geodermatophilus sp. SYSU D01106]